MGSFDHIKFDDEIVRADLRENPLTQAEKDFMANVMRQFDAIINPQEEGESR